MKTALTIAGFDPSSGAGITADLKVFAAHEIFGTAAITSLTVQSTLGVFSTHPVEPDVLRHTLQCLRDDLPPAGVKIGMTGTAPNIHIISQYLAKLNPKDEGVASVPVVLDPVLVATSGHPLLDADGVRALRSILLPLVDWITPNVDELAALTGIEVKVPADLARAARALQAEAGPRPRRQPLGVLAKGGHLGKPDDLVLTPDGEEHWLAGERIQTSATHGAGCALSSAFLCRLVLGDQSAAAARKAKDYVAEAMRRVPGIGHGKGPMKLLWPLSLCTQG